MTTTDTIKSLIRDIPDFPKKGILFKDITTMLKDPAALRASVEALAAPLRGEGITQVVGVESRGFIFAAAVACSIGAGFVPVRKKGKLPAQVRRVSYELEYGSDTLEMHADALTSRDKVVIIDDLLATGGTVAAVARLVGESGARLAGAGFLVELTFLNGRDRLKGLAVNSIVQY